MVEVSYFLLSYLFFFFIIFYIRILHYYTILCTFSNWKYNLSWHFVEETMFSLLLLSSTFETFSSSCINIIFFLSYSWISHIVCLVLSLFLSSSLSLSILSLSLSLSLPLSLSLSLSDNEREAFCRIARLSEVINGKTNKTEVFERSAKFTKNTRHFGKTKRVSLISRFHFFFLSFYYY